MRRYGDNISSENNTDEEPLNNEYTRVLFGGCGVHFGAFPRPVTDPEKRRGARISQGGFVTEILTFLGLRSKKE